jgi:hypothetical protein
MTMLFFSLMFYQDYNKIKSKILSENLTKINELSNSYEINNCETKGHLNALRSACMELKFNMSLLEKVNI